MLKAIIEALIMVSDQPMSVDRIKTIMNNHQDVDNQQIRQCLSELQDDYQTRGIQLVETASGFRFQANQDYQQWIADLFQERPPRYSRAILETLAIIAYRQPITRAEIEAIRGVAVSTSMTKALLEREWIKVLGHRDVPGRPSIYGTTKQFLDYFNLKSLSDLPSLQEIKDIDQWVKQIEDQDIQKQLEFEQHEKTDSEATVAEDESA